MSKYVFDKDKVDPGGSGTHSKFVRMIGRGKKVLEVGCASGYISAVLRDSFGCEVTGVEINAGDASVAAGICKRVVEGDIESMDLAGALGGERFDVITFGDVLEHLRDPRGALVGVRGFIAEGGYVVASIPNIAHISIILGLLEGEFAYKNLGLLDDSHIRFFTKKSILKLFRDAGYEITFWDRTVMEPATTEFGTVTEKFPLSLLSFLGEGGELLTYQFLVKAVPVKRHPVEVEQKLWEESAASELRERITRLVEKERELEETVRAQKDQIDSLLSSTSWKITAPLRWFKGKLRGN